MDLTGHFEQLVEFLKANHFASGGLVESFTLYFLGRNAAVAKEFLREAVTFCNPPEQKMVRVFTAGADDWRVSSVCRVRPPQTVVLRDGTLERLTADVKRFFDRQAWYT